MVWAVQKEIMGIKWMGRGYSGVVGADEIERKRKGWGTGKRKYNKERKGGLTDTTSIPDSPAGQQWWQRD